MKVSDPRMTQHKNAFRSYLRMKADDGLILNYYFLLTATHRFVYLYGALIKLLCCLK